MNTELVVPTLGESITEATVSKWLKNIGDSFEADEPLVEIETDKITVEVPAPHAGSLKEIKVSEGTDVEIGGILGILNYLRITFENLWIYDIWTEWELSNPYFNSDSYFSRGNTYSWLRYMYSDFGYIGCFIIPLMVVHLGMTSIYKYRRASRESLTMIPYYFIAAFIIIKSPTMMIARNEELFMIFIAVFITSLFLRLRFSSKSSSMT